MCFVNLPSSDIPRSRRFYEALGFSFDPRFTGDENLCVVVSDTIFLMVMTREKFAGFAPRPVGDPAKETSVLVALSRDSRREVEEFVAAALANGGTDNHKPQEMGDYMYGQSISDPDGNVIEVMWMDVEAAMAAWSEATPAP
jgi:predicted lactoylglutathione lyase